MDKNKTGENILNLKRKLRTIWYFCLEKISLNCFFSFLYYLNKKNLNI